ncbi:MAG: hypothetical protein DWI57_17930 [Chloroflexi bacterium]|nr:MAG: hypothetical protein DWI57_17930 [Chloroflexota bacterium]
MVERVRDYFILIGHAWICPDCRQRLLAEPETIIVGHKLSDEERACILVLTDESFGTMMTLATATGITVEDVHMAVDHPRSRLRHLGVYRRR